MAAPNQRGGSGRKKTVIRRIEQQDARQVSYAKRRVGLFNKASELSVLTGAQLAALAFPPGGKVFSFGHPSVDPVVERFLAGEGLGACPMAQGAANGRFLAAEGAGAGAGEGAADEDNVKRLAQQLAEMRTELREVKKQTKRIDKAMAKERAAGDQIAAWVDPKARDMGDEDMAAFFATLLKVKTDVSDRGWRQSYSNGLWRCRHRSSLPGWRWRSRCLSRTPKKRRSKPVSIGSSKIIHAWTIVPQSVCRQ
ncbi:hypothetical protein CFC21_050662 [Triticum aestivum]|uniref:MADS-box domain-containing protein n=2 Tax=Triticum aestivum TaxID=4565 RepID=A0A9R1G4H5_WHEAT|nr:agamous-like MADS-box protein AGL61 [Triticum aestivum]KAF7040782.1 hypothetical protein CFC21_050662 [Triticum aestivum]